MGNEIDRELEQLGVKDCPCDPAEQYEEECAVCDHDIKTPRDHIHYEHSAYHVYCFILWLLRGRDVMD